MGGPQAWIAAGALAACGMLSLATPALARAADVLDDTSRAIEPASQAVDTLAQPAVVQVVSNVPDPAKVPPPIERETPVKGSGRDAASAMPVRPGPRSTHRAVHPGAVVPIARDVRSARPDIRAETARPSPSHGGKELPPARSHRERAAGVDPVHRSHPAAIRPIGPPHHGPGVAAVSRVLETWSAAVLSALLVLAIATFVPFLLRWLRIPTPAAPRPAFAPAPAPPG
jgi:hypothetical protein